MNGSIALDFFMEELWEPMKPYFNTMMLSSPLEVTSNMAIPKTNIRSHAALLLQ